MPALDPEGYRRWLAANVPEAPVEGGLEPGVIAALEKIGPAIVIGRSAGGTLGGRIANARPELFRALIGIEPQGTCNLFVASQVAAEPHFRPHPAIGNLGRRPYHDMGLKQRRDRRCAVEMDQHTSR